MVSGLPQSEEEGVEGKKEQSLGPLILQSR